MNKQIFFAHSGGPQGRSGRGSYDFVQWLRNELGDGYQIYEPIIEEPDAPTYQMWKETVDREFPKLTNPVFLIGHSLGGSTLLKYLSEETCELQIAGLFLVAPPYWGKQGWQAEDFTLRHDFSKTLPAIPGIHLYHCLNDPVVPVDHADVYQKLIPTASIHKLNGNDHAFSDGLPVLAEHIKTTKYTTHDTNH
ncbi:serine hydrolase family protein [Rhodohalobacter sp. SW132]|uniref:alpha/beta hydrolase n=1 Tax=Rhodohalobacter sp. SW132 TaxID=2293433 RepID=UPI000E22CA6A|nr:alpha/beta hydrolase [Rhodohalobacter sp. SW132]REL24005.1 serine hydrolase family protein [Rhodohalobacter sp. SW132]